MSICRMVLTIIFGNRLAINVSSIDKAILEPCNSLVEIIRLRNDFEIQTLYNHNYYHPNHLGLLRYCSKHQKIFNRQAENILCCLILFI